MKRVIFVLLILSLLAFSVFAQQKVVVTFWEGMGAKLGTTLTQITNLFNKEHPNIEVKLVYLGSTHEVDSKVMTAIRVKALPTMSEDLPAWAAYAVSKGVVAPMGEFSDFSKVANELYPSVLKMSKINGKIYTLPFSQSMLILYYRPLMFEKAGITPPKTMQELAQDAKLLTIKKNGKIVRYGLGFRTTFGSFSFVAFQFGGQYIKNGKLVINSPQNVKALTFLVNLVKKGYAYAQNGYLDSQFTTSSIAMSLGGAAQLSYILSDIAGQKDGIAMAPIPRDVAFHPEFHGPTLVIYNTSTKVQQKAAWEYVKFLLSPVVQLFWSMNTNYPPLNKRVVLLPQWKAYVQNNSYHIGSMLVGISKAIAYTPTVGWWPGVDLAIQTAFEDAIHFTKSPQEALDQAQKQAEQIRAKFLNK